MPASPPSGRGAFPIRRLTVIEYRIEMSNNSDARRADVLTSLGVKGKHNGGKTVIALVPESDAERAEATLDADYRVRSYERSEAP